MFPGGMTKSYGQECPVACALDVVGERWAFLIVRDLLDGPRRFAELEASNGSIAPNMLSARLKTLEDAGVVVRTVRDGRPPRTDYALTDKGRELGAVVGALAAWGARHALPGAKFEHTKCGHALEVRLHCPHCKRVAKAEERRIVVRR
jgi:DNA-binding HxlR family transcriptional regulator